MNTKFAGILAAFALFLGLGLSASSSEAAAIKGDLKAIQQEVGEYFFADDYPENFKKLDEKDVASDVVTLAEKYLAGYLADMTESSNDAVSAEIWSYYEVIDEQGRPVGYVVEIIDQIDHPLWDGSGLNLWLDLELNVVAEVSWSM